MSGRKYWIWTGVLLIIFGLIGFFFLRPGSRPFRYGLDLVGGTELVYKADTSKTDDRNGAMESLKGVIEKRVNVFGVSEPIIQTEHAGFISGVHDDRLIVELPGVTDIEKAKELIGATPTLEFRIQRAVSSTTDMLIVTGLTGEYLDHAQVVFDSNTNQPQISLKFNSDGAKLLAKITEQYKGQQMAILLDGQVLSSPVIQDVISNGEAQITGRFTFEEAQALVRNLNYGALPVPISLLSSQTIGASLGSQALDAGTRAGIIGFIALVLFLIFWYRLPGIIASIALVFYVMLSLTVFKLIPVTLTAAGLAGFILSIGMAVDANVLIFERTKEELKKGKGIKDSLHEGFHRAWLSIRDSNISSIITAVILWWLGTSAVKGFALTLGIGVMISMFTAITVSRTFLFAVAPKEEHKGDKAQESKFKRFLFSNGFHVGS